MPKLYEALASWWPLMSPPADYAEEAAFYAALLTEACGRTPQSVLELGSGGGNNASHLKAHFPLVLVEPSSGMLAVSGALNPECEHVQGDMRAVRLGRQFDGVFVHDAVGYLTSEADLSLAVATAFAHCRPGGAALFAPDAIREHFRPSTGHGGSDNTTHGLRYVAWTWDPDPSDNSYLTDYAYLLRAPDGSVTVEHDRHEQGLFARDVWLRLLRDAGFVPRAVRFDHSEIEPGSYEIFVACRPSAAGAPASVL